MHQKSSCAQNLLLDEDASIWAGRFSMRSLEIRYSRVPERSDTDSDLTDSVFPATDQMYPYAAYSGTASPAQVQDDLEELSKSLWTSTSPT